MSTPATDAAAAAAAAADGGEGGATGDDSRVSAATGRDTAHGGGCGRVAYACADASRVGACALAVGMLRESAERREGGHPHAAGRADM